MIGTGSDVAESKHKDILGDVQTALFSRRNTSSNFSVLGLSPTCIQLKHSKSEFSPSLNCMLVTNKLIGKKKMSPNML